MTTETFSQPTLNSYGAVRLVDEQAVQLDQYATSPMLDNDWSVAFRVRLRAAGTTKLCAMGMAVEIFTGPPGDSTLKVKFYTTGNGGVGQTFDTRCPLDVWTWYNIAMTVHMTATGYEAMLYVNGAPFGAGGAPDDPFIVVGHCVFRETNYPHLGGRGVDSEYMNVAIWNRVIDGTEIIQYQYEPPSQAGLVESYDFSSPSHSGIPNVSFRSGSWVSISNGVRFGAGVALPDPRDDVNPGGNLEQSFSIEAWMRSTPPCNAEDATAQLAIISNGTLDAEPFFAFGCKYGPDLKSFVLSVKMPEIPAPIKDTRKLLPHVWYNVIVTWDAVAKRLSFYVNGQPTSTATLKPPANPGLSEPQVVIAAANSSSSPNGFSRFYLGYLQGVGVWGRVLTPQQIESYDTPQSGSDEGMTALFDFSNTEFTNAVTGRYVAFKGYAPFLCTDDTDFVESSARDQPASIPDKEDLLFDLAALQVVDGKLPSSEIDLTAPPSSTRFTEDQVKRLQTQLDFYLGHVPEPLKPGMRKQMQRALRNGLRRADLAAGSVPGMFTSEIEGEDRVFYCHTANGPVETMRIDARRMDNCTAWKISLVTGAFCIVLCVLGVRFSLSDLSKAILATYEESLIFAKTLAQVGEEILTASGILSIIGVSLSAGFFGPIVRTAIRGAGVKWWSLAYNVASIVATVVAMFASGGWYIAFVAAQIMLNIVSMVFTYEAGIKKGCSL